MGENRRAVVYTVDGNVECIYQMEDSIKTVRKFFGDIDIVVCTNAPDASFDRKYGMEVLDVSDIVKEYGLDHTGVYWRGRECSPMLLMRLAIPLMSELRKYDKVLYLDSDTEIWSEEALRLFEIDDEGHEITAVRDELRDRKVKARIERVDRSAPRPDDWLPYPQRWNLLYDAKAYVNSGVIVFNLAKFGTVEEYAERFRFTVEQLKARHPPYPDQDILNIFYDIYIILDRRYNSWKTDPDHCFLRHNVGGVRRVTKFYPPEHSVRPFDRIHAVEKNPDMGVFSGKVDRVAVIADAEDPDRERETLGFLNDEYGIVGPKVTRSFRSPLFTHVAKSGIPAEEGLTDDDMSRFFGHYFAAKDAYVSGADKVLFVDASFNLPSGDAVDAAVGSLPVEYDCAVFDTEYRGELPKTPWIVIGAEGVRIRAKSPSMYMMSRRCLKQYLWLFESLPDPNTPYRTVRRIQRWLGDALRGKQRIFFMNKNAVSLEGQT